MLRSLAHNRIMRFLIEKLGYGFLAAALSVLLVKRRKVHYSGSYRSAMLGQQRADVKSISASSCKM